MSEGCSLTSDEPDKLQLQEQLKGDGIRFRRRGRTDYEVRVAGPWWPLELKVFRYVRGHHTYRTTLQPNQIEAIRKSEGEGTPFFLAIKTGDEKTAHIFGLLSRDEFRTILSETRSQVHEDVPANGESCAICGCAVHREGDYARPTRKGSSHATRHHYVAKRFFGRSANSTKQPRGRIFRDCPWRLEGQTAVYCYECHEELLHNPVLLPEDVNRFAELVALRHLSENDKPESREKIAGRIMLLHEVLEVGLKSVLVWGRASAARHDGAN